MPKLVETPLGVVEFPDNMQDTEIQSVLDRNFGVAPPESPSPPGFGELLGQELSQGFETASGPLGPLGVMQMLGAPVTAGAKAVGHQVLERTGSPVAAGVADAVTDVALGGMIGKAGQLASKGFRRGIAPRLPGAGSALLEEGISKAEALPTKILPGVSSDDLFAALDQMQVPPVELPRFNQVASQLSKQEKDLSKFGLALPRISRIAKAGEKATAASAQVPFENVQALRRRLGVAISAARRQGGEELGDLKQLFKALSDDLEQAAGPEFGLLRQANRAARKEFASEDLGEIVRKGINRPRQGSDFPDVSYAQMLKGFNDKIAKDDLFKGSFSASEIKEIQSTLADLAKIPAKPPGRGVMAGSFRLGGRAAFGMLGGQAMGLDPSTGALLGIGASEAISNLLQAPNGRKVLLGIIRREPRIGPQSVALLTAASRMVSALSDAGDVPLSTREPSR